jgi:hypothetical protein
LIEIEVALIAIYEIKDQTIFIIGLSYEIGTISIDGIESKQGGIVIQFSVDEYVFGKDIIGEKENVVR